ncbi:efflux RND transporter permease subunit [Pseudomonas borbori]|uniref:SSD domain-containing protein n=1 Tax=Pseudomonas borbori TaxID=289003 RepID=A0A1I5XB82_9PSED|nr:MMPL family transporter [Pseudomonas borbori]SFQ29238.1 hypothetical protein SAMN05216190_15410 [Pseudomonas borbori]
MEYNKLSSQIEVPPLRNSSIPKLALVLFRKRNFFLAVCAIITILLAVQAAKLSFNANFEAMLPQKHPYMQNYFGNIKDLQGFGNSLSIVVENRDGSILQPDYLDALAKLNDAVFLLPGVDRAWMQSLWSPAVRWTEVTEEGFAGGPVMPRSYDGTKKTIKELEDNIRKAGLLGTLVGADMRSSMIKVPLLSIDAETGEPVDYAKFVTLLDEQVLRVVADHNINVRVVGFAQLIGELINGFLYIALFFLITILLVGALLYWYVHSIRCASLVLFCSLMAVVWQLGLVAVFDFSLDPYTVLVPFVVFAIGVSHGAQIMNGVVGAVADGVDKVSASENTLCRLFIPGMAALLSDAVGFAILVVIDIPVIRELAITASVGIGALIITNLFLLPILFSYAGIGEKAKRRASSALAFGNNNSLESVKIYRWAAKLVEPGWGGGVLFAATLLGVFGIYGSMQVKVGDLDAGAPELWPSSKYNIDVGYINKHYSLSSDVFAVMVKTPVGQCSSLSTLVAIDRLQQKLSTAPGVMATASLADSVRQHVAGTFEGSPKWFTLPRNEQISSLATHEMSGWGSELVNKECSLVPVLAYLSDHKADTLQGVLTTAEDYALAESTDERQFLLAAGSAGIDAVRNIVVKEASLATLIYVYLAVIVLSYIAFRSIAAVVVALLPLMLTSVLTYALMSYLGIGIKVGTLAVVALGVGTGIDYAMYLLSDQLKNQRGGYSLKDSYLMSLRSSGKVVALIGVTLAAGVMTWIFSPIKFQADMGVLLTFMFIWNMLGALILIPALSGFLLKDVGKDCRPFVLLPPPPAASE